MSNAHRRRGLTVAELMILVFVIGAITMVGVGTCARAVGTDDGTAETEARAFAKQLGLTVRGVSCAGYDSDGDGYVSCTLSVTEGTESRVLAVECARAVSFNTGCRLQKPGMANGGVR